MSRIRGVFGYELVSKNFIHWLPKYEHEFLGWASCPTLPYQSLLGTCFAAVAMNISHALSHACRMTTVYPKKYAHGFCFAVLCCGYTLNDFPISIRLTSLALWQSNDCHSASKATLMNLDKYFMWIHYERLHNHNKAKHNKTVCIFLGIYCTCTVISPLFTWNRQKMRNRWLGSFYAPSLILSNGLLLRLYAKICFKSFNISRWRHTMCLHRTGPSHSVNGIRSAHNVASHTESTQVLNSFRAPSPWSPN